MVVRRIFAMALSGQSCHSIASQLNQEGVPPPSVYAGIPLKNGRFAGLWISERISEMLQNETYIGNMVQGRQVKINYKSKKCLKQPPESWVVVENTRISEMLQNETYIGNMVQGRQVKINYKSKKCLKQPPESWVVVENTHEPLVDRETFRQVRLLVNSRKYTRSRTYDYLLKGMVYCHECGALMTVANRPGDLPTDPAFVKQPQIHPQPYLRLPIKGYGLLPRVRCADDRSQPHDHKGRGPAVLHLQDLPALLQSRALHLPHHQGGHRDRGCGKQGAGGLSVLSGPRQAACPCKGCFTKAGLCTCHTIKVDTVTEAVVSKVREVCQSYLDQDKLLVLAKDALAKNAQKNKVEIQLAELQKKIDLLTSNLDRMYTDRLNGLLPEEDFHKVEIQLAELQKKIDLLTSNLDRMYTDRLNGLLPEEDFQRIFNRTKSERQQLELQQADLRSLQKNPVNSSDKAKELVQRFVESACASRELLVSLVDRIELTQDKQKSWYSAL